MAGPRPVVLPEALRAFARQRLREHGRREVARVAVSIAFGKGADHVLHRAVRRPSGIAQRVIIVPVDGAHVFVAEIAELQVRGPSRAHDGRAGPLIEHVRAVALAIPEARIAVRSPTTQRIVVRFLHPLHREPRGRAVLTCRHLQRDPAKSLVRDGERRRRVARLRGCNANEADNEREAEEQCE